MGERAINLIRVFSPREGLTAADDRLPKRFLELHPDGVLSDHGMDAVALDEALHGHYGMMGWNRVSGVPSLDKLDELNIGWAKQRLF